MIVKKSLSFVLYPSFYLRSIQQVCLDTHDCFRLAVVLETGTTVDGTAVTGKIEIPEVAHDTDVDDYVVSSQIYH